MIMQGPMPARRARRPAAQAVESEYGANVFTISPTICANHDLFLPGRRAAAPTVNAYSFPAVFFLNTQVFWMK